MFGVVADLVRGLGLPWNGAAYLCIVGLVLFIALRIGLYMLLYVSYLVVSGLRRANVSVPGFIYAMESAIYKLRRRLTAVLCLGLVLVAGWIALYLGRSSLEGGQIVALEYTVTSMVQNLIGDQRKGS